MSAGYYAPGAARADKVRELFSRIARRYDFINDLQSAGLHRVWKRKMVRLSGVSSGMRALDVCCGTGDIGKLLAARGALTTGCDFSREMLHAAPLANRIQNFVQGDALNLPFRDAVFDLATISYGLRNLADFGEGMREIVRVCRPGARILILDFGRPGNRVWRTLYFTYLRAAVPLFGRLFAWDAAAYRYILDSLENYPAQKGVARLLESLGCLEVEVVDLLGGVMSIHSARGPGQPT